MLTLIQLHLVQLYLLKSLCSYKNCFYFQDFFFKQLLKVRLRPSPKTLLTERVSLLTVSNKYGLAFAGIENGKYLE